VPTPDEPIASLFRPLSEEEQSQLNEWLAKRKFMLHGRSIRLQWISETLIGFDRRSFLLSVDYEY